MASVRWFLLDDAGVPAAIADGGPRHADETGGARLSVAWNVAGTQALVTVDGASKAWRVGKTWIANCAAVNGVYDRDNRYEIFDWFYTSEWSPPEEDGAL